MDSARWQKIQELFHEAAELGENERPNLRPDDTLEFNRTDSSGTPDDPGF